MVVEIRHSAKPVAYTCITHAYERDYNHRAPLNPFGIVRVRQAKLRRLARAPTSRSEQAREDLGSYRGTDTLVAPETLWYIFCVRQMGKQAGRPTSFSPYMRRIFIRLFFILLKAFFHQKRTGGSIRRYDLAGFDDEAKSRAAVQALDGKKG